MTVLVGILCSDGVVIASDSAATFGTGQMATIGQQTTRKVHKLSPSMIFAATGAVGMAQVFADVLSRGYAANAFRNAATADEMMNKLGLAINTAVLPYLQSAQSLRQLGAGVDASLCKSMIAMDVKGTPLLLTFDFNGAPERATKELPFVSMGSGQPIADPFLAFLHRLLWKNSQPTIAEGRLAAIWTIDHVCKTNPGGVGGNVQLMILTKKPDVLELGDGEVEEHKQQAAGAEAAFVKFLRPEAGPIVSGAAEAPPIPQPPAEK